MKSMFGFNPHEYASTYAREGYVHIRQGLTEEFYQVLAKQVEDYLQGELLKNFAIGDKQQALYQFPGGRDYHGELVESVAQVCGLDPAGLVLSERHIKAYEAKAIPDPLAHKDRFASEVSVGFSVRVSEGSTLVLYPYDEQDVNPFNSSTELRASLKPADLPEATLKGGRHIEISDQPRDVIMFRGNAIWHLRSKPAGTVMLYLKLNSFNCDPLGEDPTTTAFRKRTQDLLAQSDEELEQMIPLLGRRVDYIQRRCNRDWKEVIGVVLWGERHFSIDEQDLKALQAIDGRRTVRHVITAMGAASPRAVRAGKVRYLAARGAVDLTPAKVATNGTGGSRSEAVESELSLV